MGKPLRVGIISANWGVKCHLPAWRAVSGVEVAAICTSRESTARAAAAEYGIAKPYWDFRQMISDPAIDLIDIGTRPNLRYEMAKVAIAAGKHIYAGVPLAADIAQAEELVTLARARGISGASDAYFEHIPAHAEMKRRIDAGELGELHTATVDVQINLFNPPAPDFSYLWFARRENGASALRNLGSHTITLLTALFGEISEVVGLETRHMAAWDVPNEGIVEPEVGDTAHILMRLSRGGMANVNLSWVAAGGVGWRIDAQGSKARLSAVHEGSFPNHDQVRLFHAGANLPLGAEIALPATLTHDPDIGINWTTRPLPCYPMALSFRRLKRAIEGRGVPSPDLDRALHVERVIAAVGHSSQSRGWVSVS
jgi:predicted dehydrogenase